MCIHAWGACTCTCVWPAVLVDLHALPHKVSRVGHGVRAIEDTAVVERIVRDGIVLEVCPGSNLALGIYGALRFHPVNLLRRAGCRITLNSDDPPFFGTSLAQEYETCARTFGWDRAQSLEITRTAIAGAFCDEDTRARLLRAVATAEDAPPDPA